MDLRPYLKAADGGHALHGRIFERGMKLVQNGELWYQPFILADGVEVGEGQNLEEGYRNTSSIFDHNVFLSPEFRPYWDGNPRKLAADGAYFRACNQKYRFGYELLADHIVARAGGDLSEMSVMEIGCNTGLNLFHLAARGAKSCIGIDWSDHSAAFDWLNDVLKTRVQFIRGSYDNLTHSIWGVEVPVADVVLNTVFLNHQCDPIEALCYLADHARKALFLWVLLDNRSDEMTVTYHHTTGVHDLGATRPMPLSFHNDIRVSAALLTECLRRLGFEDIEFIAPPPDIDVKLVPSLVPFQMVWARRTHERPSAFRLEYLGLSPEIMARKLKAAGETISELERQMSALRNSRSFRVGQLLMRPMHRATRLFRSD